MTTDECPDRMAWLSCGTSSISLFIMMMLGRTSSPPLRGCVRGRGVGPGHTHPQSAEGARAATVRWARRGLVPILWGSNIKQLYFTRGKFKVMITRRRFIFGDGILVSQDLPSAQLCDSKHIHTIVWPLPPSVSRTFPSPHWHFRPFKHQLPGFFFLHETRLYGFLGEKTHHTCYDKVCSFLDIKEIRPDSQWWKDYLDIEVPTWPTPFLPPESEDRPEAPLSSRGLTKGRVGLSPWMVFIGEKGMWYCHEMTKNRKKS